MKEKDDVLKVLEIIKRYDFLVKEMKEVVVNIKRKHNINTLNSSILNTRQALEEIKDTLLKKIGENQIGGKK